MPDNIIPLHRGKPVTRPLSETRTDTNIVTLDKIEAHLRAGSPDQPGRHIVIGDPPVPMGFYIICLAIGFCMGAVIGWVS